MKLVSTTHAFRTCSIVLSLVILSSTSFGTSLQPDQIWRCQKEYTKSGYEDKVRQSILSAKGCKCLTANCPNGSLSQEPRTNARAKSSGTAFAIAPDSLITNHHVIAGCTSIEIVSSQNRFPGTTVDSDVRVDLALLNVPGLNSPVAKLRRPAKVRLGEQVMVFGFPLAGALSSGGNFTSGLVSALQGLGDANGELQITAPVQPGNSGGPLLDASGLVIGVVEAKLDALKVSRAIGDIPQNVNFALSLETLVGFLKQRKVEYIDTASSGQLEATSIAATAQTFTYRVECMGEGSKQAVINSEAVSPVPQAVPPPAKRMPTPAEIQANRDSVRSAITGSLFNQAAPVPVFETSDARLQYLRWLGRTSERMKERIPDWNARKEFLQTAWYESTRAGLDPGLVLGLIEAVSGFRKLYLSENGSRGYMAVSPYWVQVLSDGDVQKLFHTQYNFRFGCVVLKHYLVQRKGDQFLALTDYYRDSVLIAGKHQPDHQFPNLVLRNMRNWNQ